MPGNNFRYVSGKGYNTSWSTNGKGKALGPTMFFALLAIMVALSPVEEISTTTKMQVWNISLSHNFIFMDFILEI